MEPSNLVNINYDFSVTLQQTDNLYFDDVFDECVVFSPNNPGMPTLITIQQYELLSYFKEPITAGAALILAQQKLNMSFAEVVESIALFQDHGYLQSTEDEEIVDSQTYKVSSLGIWLHISNHCNLSCSYCFVNKDDDIMTDSGADLAIEQILSTIQKHNLKNVQIKLAGGEPSLRMDSIKKFYEKLSKKIEGIDVNIGWSMLTNGTVASDKLIDFAKEINMGFGISLDGYGEYHDIYRVFYSKGDSSKPKRGSWGIISKNIDQFLEEGIDLQINMTVSAESAPSLPDLAKWVFDRGISSRISVVRNLGGDWADGEGRREKYSEYCDYMAQQFEEMFKHLENSYVYLDPNKMYIADLSFDKPLEGMPCGVGSNYVTIRHDGKISSCPMTISEQSIQSNGDLLESCKSSFPYDPNDRVDSGKDCLSCQWFKVCASGCPVTNSRFNGHPFTKSPLCKFWKYVIPRYIKFHGLMSYRKKYANNEMVKLQCTVSQPPSIALQTIHSSK